MKKRIVFLLLAASVAIGVAGCGKKKTTAPADTEAARQTEAAAEDTEAESAEESADADSTETEAATDETAAPADGAAALSSLTPNAEGVYEIASAEDLVSFRELAEIQMQEDFNKEGYGGTCSETVVLTADIDLSTVCGPEIGSWRPIGFNSISYTHGDEEQITSGNFSGTFDGNGHTISNLYINETEVGGALFGAVLEGTIRNLTISDSQISGASGPLLDETGGVAAVAMFLRNGTIENVTLTDSVTVSGIRCVGGIASYADEDVAPAALIQGCSSSATVRGDDYVGGIVGLTQEETDIFNCSNSGTVSGGNSTGGIVGYANGGSYYYGKIFGCVNYGTVAMAADAPSAKKGGEQRSIGGIVGFNNSTVMFCANAGTVDGQNYLVFDIGDNEGTMRDNFNLGTVITSKPEYAYTTVDEDSGVNLSFKPDDKALTDGTLLKQLNENYSTEYWIQGEKFPVWNNQIPDF